MQELEHVAVIHLGDPHYNRRFETLMKIFLRNYVHVDYLTYYKRTLPKWLRSSPLVSYLYMDAAFVYTAPDNLFFWLIYPIQLIFDAMYTLFHIFLFCKSKLRAIIVFSAPFRPGCVIGARMAAKYLKIPLWIDVCREPHSLEYTGLRANIIYRLEKLLIKSKYREETLLLDSNNNIEHFDLKKNFVLTLNTPALLPMKLPPQMHHMTLSRLRFSQPEQTSLGVRTLFHYAQLVRSPGDNYDHAQLEINKHRPALILCPCSFRGADDFEGIYQLAVILERMFESYAVRTSKNMHIRFTSAIIVVTGRTDPYVCMRTRTHHKQLKAVADMLNNHYTMEEGRKLMQHLNELESASKGDDYQEHEEDKKCSVKKSAAEARAAREEKLAKSRMLLRMAMREKADAAKGISGAKNVRMAKCYLYSQDYQTLLDCADMVYISKHDNENSSIPAALLDALLYEKIVFRNYVIKQTDELSELVASATVEVTNHSALSSNLVLALNQEEARAKEAKEYEKELHTKISAAKEYITKKSYMSIFYETLLPQILPPDVSVEDFQRMVQACDEEVKRREEEQLAESERKCSCGSGSCESR